MRCEQLHDPGYGHIYAQCLWEPETPGLSHRCVSSFYLREKCFWSMVRVKVSVPLTAMVSDCLANDQVANSKHQSRRSLQTKAILFEASHCCLIAPHVTPIFMYAPQCVMLTITSLLCCCTDHAHCAEHPTRPADSPLLCHFPTLSRGCRKEGAHQPTGDPGEPR